MPSSFSDLGLHPSLVQTVTDLGYTEPTPIQAGLIPVLLTGRDAIGQAQTGTGKTAAFSLPLLHHLTPGSGAVQALVLAPTRELAMQVANTLYTYGRARQARVLPVYGGQPYHRQIRRLQQGVDIVVGTPGRLLDLIRQQALDLGQVRTVVLDEADEMLSMGFIDDIEAILQATPAERQTAVLSATLPAPIRRLAIRYLRDPETVAIGTRQRTAATVEQRYYLVHQRDKLAALTRLLEMEPVESVLVFARTRANTVAVAHALTDRGYPAEALNGEMNQPVRTQVLARFRTGQTRILVGTDVAARGLDIDHISHVVNLDLPRDPEVYVHRIGRTGRAGKTGVAISLLTPADRRSLRTLEAYIQEPITRAVLPTEADVEARRSEAWMERMRVWLRRERGQREREMAEALIAEGHDPVAVAAAAIKMARTEARQRPAEPIAEVRTRSTPSEARRPRRERDHRRPEPMVRLSLNLGRSHGIRVNHIVGSLAHYADIPGRVLGKIRIQDHRTLVDVPPQFVGQVLAREEPYRIGSKTVTIERV
ncbi:RNA helicase [Rhodothermaceae bacterium RA]|nr:RNA helicase [Rhodothermaceae bacterium RA]